MKHINLGDHILYDGSQIEPMWAFRQLGIKESNIVTWTGPMEIKPEKIIDYEDASRKIKADRMVHFIIEHFDCQPANIRMCYHRQRLFVMITKEVLEDFGIKTKRIGDDLYIDGRKLSVSIATCSTSSMKIHFGMNLTSKGTPEDVATIGLFECEMDDERIHELVNIICKKYIGEVSSIEEDIAKTKVF